MDSSEKTKYAQKLKDQSVELSPTKRVQEIHVSEDFLRIHCPCRVLLSGPSQVGKSRLIFDLLKYRHLAFSEQFDRIIMCIPENARHSITNRRMEEDLRSICEKIEIVEGLPNYAQLGLFESYGNSHTLIIIEVLLSWQHE